MSGAAVRLRANWSQLKNSKRNVLSWRSMYHSLTASERPGIVIGVTTTSEEDNGQQFALTESGDDIDIS
jgi:hypothetical protein